MQDYFTVKVKLEFLSFLLIVCIGNLTKHDEWNSIKLLIEVVQKISANYKLIVNYSLFWDIFIMFCPVNREYNS